MMKIETTNFLKYVQGENGITITELQSLKDTATNWMQDIRQPFQQAIPYDRTFKPAGWDSTTQTIGFVPDSSTLVDQVKLEGRLNAFNEFATSVINGFNSEKKRIENASWRQFVNLPKGDHPKDAVIKELTEKLAKLNSEPPVRKSIQEPVQADEAKELFDYLDANELYDYLEANQTASAMGNLILSNPGNSRNPRNFLYQVFESDYVPTVREGVLYTPMLRGSALEEYKRVFFLIQGIHREQEKAKNAFKARHNQYDNELKAQEQEDYNAKLREYEAAVKEENIAYGVKFSQWNAEKADVFNTLKIETESRQREVNSQMQTLEQEAELLRKQLKEELYKRRVWLPEKARQMMQEIKVKRGV